jgi:glutathione S-transferase
MPDKLWVAATAAAAGAAYLYYTRRSTAPVVSVTYWGGRGLCEPLRCILAAAGVEFTDVTLKADTGAAELGKLRAAGKLQFDQLPLVQVDDLNLVQTRATATYLGARFGLLPTSPAEVYLVESVYGSSQDARMPMVGLPFAQYPEPPTAADFEKKLAELHGPKGLIGRYATKWEAMLGDGPFFLGR